MSCLAEITSLITLRPMSGWRTTRSTSFEDSGIVYVLHSKTARL